MIEAEKAIYTVKRMCGLLEASRSEVGQTAQVPRPQPVAIAAAPCRAHVPRDPVRDG